MNEGDEMSEKTNENRLNIQVGPMVHARNLLKIDKTKLILTALGMGIFVIYLCLCSPFHGAQAQASAYYVSTSGNDSNPGTSDKPWRTIQKAADSIGPGDEVLVNAGSYAERVTVNKSGTSDSQITFRADGEVDMYGFYITGDYVTIDGFTATSQVCSWNQDAFGIYVSGDHCIIENNYAYYNPRGGINLAASSSQCIVRNNKANRNGMVGIQVQGQDHLIENNESWGSISYHTPTGCEGDADGFRFFGSGHIFRGNYVHDIDPNDPENKGYSPHIDGFQTWEGDGTPVGNNCIFEGNVIMLEEALQSGAGFQFEGPHDIILRNNIVNVFRGVLTYQNERSPYIDPYNLTIVNNLFLGDLSFNPNQWPSGVAFNDTTHSLVKNNIFLDQAGHTIYIASTSSDIDTDYNLFFNSDGSSPMGDREAHDVWQLDPKFVDFAGGDYHLLPDSPAIDAGASLLSVNDDYDGNPRPQLQGYDIGPFEYLSASTEDINEDGKVDALDLQICINTALGWDTNPRADVNKDGAVDFEDVQQIVDIILQR
jgi:parallel beta-helix repeat protein